jgi:hypothetical protein
MQSDPCQFLYDIMKATSIPRKRATLWRTLRRLIWDIALVKPLEFLSKKLGNAEPWQTMQKHLWHIGVFGPKLYLSSIFPSIRAKKKAIDRNSNNAQKRSDKSRMSFKKGDSVEIKSFEEIFKTLDKEGRHRGLSFTKEMIQFCGKQFRVYKKLERIVLESTGEMRRMRTPTVLLEGVFCDGSAHGNCDRSCFAFWREDWLKQASEPVNESKWQSGMRV